MKADIELKEGGKIRKLILRFGLDDLADYYSMREIEKTIEEDVIPDVLETYGLRIKDIDYRWTGDIKIEVEVKYVE